MSDFNEYIDIRVALRRIGGSMDLYKELLSRFLNGNYIELLETAFSSGSLDDAAHKIHSLKGICANLSLIKLSAETEKLEKKVHEGTDYLDCFANLKEIYKKTSEYISEIT